MDDKAMFAKLKGVTTATLTTVLLKKGIRKCWMTGTRPFSADQERVVGRAFTMRFIPGREDVATPASWGSPRSTRAAIEDMPEGVICVIDSMGIKEAGVYGDILTARMKKRGVAALVTDGVLRDAKSAAATGMPIWCDGAAAPPSVAALHFVGWQEPIGCGGCAVFPGDVIVADSDGAVVIPAEMAEAVTELSVEQERLETWIMGEVEKGIPLPGLYPANEETKARYERDKASGKA
jgi:regulator of RNase E activity RraA